MRLPRDILRATDDGDGRSAGGGVRLDCRDFREQKLADPFARDDAVARHAERCPPCAKFAAELEVFEHRLRDCIDCEVPDDLGTRILAQPRADDGPAHIAAARARESMPEPASTSASAAARAAARKSWLTRLLDRLGGGTKTWLMPALAGFGGVFALGIVGTVSFHLLGGPPPLARTMIAHVRSEPAIFSLDQVTLDTDVRDAFGALGGTVGAGGDVARSLGRVRFLGTCVIDGKRVQHLLVDTDDGEATLLLMPGERVDTGVSSENGFSAAVIPLRQGSLGVVTRSPDSAAKVRTRLRRAMQIEG